ncbi:hypothetical protein [Marinobacter sp. MIT932201]|uniref:hypothetical protein n=1 Tax=Marinobacter sp. MIT932201 TaxID=3096995 RepID=UPI00399B83A0
MFKKLKNLIFGRSSYDVSAARGESAQKQVRFTMRAGKLVETDAVFDAWTSGDIARMQAALAEKTNLVDRHFLLMSLVDQSYKYRKDDPELEKLCAEISEQHIQEFPEIKPALVKSLDGLLPRVTTFQKYATLLTEQNNFDRAVEVCDIAISHGLHDGTKGGFEGRIERIKRKAAKHSA